MDNSSNSLEDMFSEKQWVHFPSMDCLSSSGEPSVVHPSVTRCETEFLVHATIMTYHRLSDLNNRNVFPTALEARNLISSFQHGCERSPLSHRQSLSHYVPTWHEETGEKERMDAL